MKHRDVIRKAHWVLQYWDSESGFLKCHPCPVCFRILLSYHVFMWWFQFPIHGFLICARHKADRFFLYLYLIFPSSIFKILSNISSNYQDKWLMIKRGLFELLYDVLRNKLGDDETGGFASFFQSTVGYDRFGKMFWFFDGFVSLFWGSTLLLSSVDKCS